MPGPTVGYAEIKVDFDGSRLPTEAAKLAKQAGGKMGKDSVFAFNDEFSGGLNAWSRDLTKKMAKGGKIGSKSFAKSVEASLKRDLSRMGDLIAGAVTSRKGFARLAKEVGGSDEAIKQLNQSLQTLVDNGELSETSIKKMSTGINRWAKELKDSEAAAASEAAAQKAAAAATKQAADDRTLAAESLRRSNEKTRKENERLGAVLRDVNLTLGNQRNWDVLVENAGNSTLATARLTDQMNELHKTGKITDTQYKLLTSRIDEFSTAAERGSSGVARHGKSLNLFARAADKASSSYRRMDSTVRLVIGLIVSGASDMAALGSAAGAGVLGLAAAFSQLVIAGVGVGTVFNRLNKDLKDLPASMRPVAAEWQAFQETFGSAADIIAGSAFAQMGGVFTNLARTMQGLGPALSQLGDGVGQAFKGFSDAFRVGQAGFVELDKLIRNSADTFLGLSDFMGTFTVALVRGFNKANPLVEDLVGWMQELADQFDLFTRSKGFDVWVENARDVFGSLRGIIDATFRSLNDLADQDAVARLTATLDNLALAIPRIFDALDVISVLDPLGLAAEALARLLEAVEPLHAPMLKFAEATNALWTSGINLVVPVVAAFADVLGGLLDAAPPSALIALVAALVAFRTVGVAVTGLNLLATGLNHLGFQIDLLPKKVGKMKALGRGLGLAGLFAGLATAMSATNTQTELTVDKLAKLDNAFKTGGSGMEQFKDQISFTGKTAEEMRGHLNNMFTGDFMQSGQAWHDTIEGLTFGLTGLGDEFENNKAAYREMGANLADVANTDLKAAQDGFARLVEGFGGGDEVIRQLLVGMPDFEAKLHDLAGATGETLTQQELFNLAVGDMELPMSAAQQQTLENADALAEMQGKAGAAGDEIDSLADTIRGFGSATLDVNAANRDFQAAIDDLTASIAANGTSLNITEEAGRANQAALEEIATTALEVAGATLEQTGSQEKATAALAAGREELILSYMQFGFTRQQAEAYADQLGLIPSNIKTASDFAKDPDARSYSDTVTRIPDRIDTVAHFTVTGYSTLLNAQAVLRSITGSHSAHIAFGAGGQGGQTFASGGILTGPRRILAGEAGPEAIVPLNRPLWKVDPSVRALSAVAQGGSMASGGVVGAGPQKQVTVMPGAIVVNASQNPINTATAVLDRIVARL